MPDPLNLLNLRIPALAAPMFLVSGTELVVATCAAGLAASFPAANARTSDILEQWLVDISQRHNPKKDAPWGVNLNTHRLNSRLERDLLLTCIYQAPFVVTALGAPAAVVEAIHAYGGLVLADVTTTYHARKAAASGADALILVCAGAGGHTGQLAPMAFINEVREFWAGPLILAGAISTGQDIVSALTLGADYAYLGSRFIACDESMAKHAYREMIVSSKADDIICTSAFTGIPNNMLKPSIVKAGLDPNDIPPHEHSKLNFDDPHANTKAWRDIWSAGHGIGSIHSSLPASALVTQLEKEFRDAAKRTAKRLNDYQNDY